jgi:hypothetical protein
LVEFAYALWAVITAIMVTRDWRRSVDEDIARLSGVGYRRAVFEPSAFWWAVIAKWRSLWGAIAVGPFALIATVRQGPTAALITAATVMVVPALT